MIVRALVMTGLAGFAATAAAAQDGPETIFQRGQQIEMRLSAGGWRKCTITDPGAEYRVARADCERFPTPGYTYPAGEENFSAKGTADVRLPGACTTTSPYLNQRNIPGCRSAGAPATRPPAAPRPPAAARPAPAAQPVAAGPKLERCTPGMRVLTPGGLAATVVSAQGAGCTIKTDVGNKSIDGTFAAFMLRPIGKAPAGTTTPNGAGRLPLGEYGCIGLGTTQLAGMGSKLLAGGRYTDLEGGSPGTYRIVGNTIQFSGGHLNGQVGRDIKDNGYTIGRISCQKW
jgi:hypothetical protein